MLGEAITYLLAPPLVQSGKGVNRLKMAYGRALIGRFPSKNQLNDALIESYTADFIGSLYPPGRETEGGS